MNTAKSLLPALQVVHRASPAPAMASDAIRVHDVQFEGSNWEKIAIECFREYQVDNYIYRRSFWRDEMEEFCWERFDFGERSFLEWWTERPFEELMAICTDFLAFHCIGPSLDAHYAAWLTKQAIS